MSKLKKILSLRNRVSRRTLLIGAAATAVALLFSAASVQGWEYSNSVNFCANTCHDVHPEESEAFHDSYHARVKCTECHMGRLNVWQSVVIKSTHFRRGPAVLLNRYGRPTHSESMRPANESCERCHWPPAFHSDTVREIKHFAPDQDNTEKRTYLILKTGAGDRESGLGYGIHWHITNPVEYIATDEHSQDIRWVRTTLPDGRTVEYNDVINPMTPEEFTEAKVHIVDCADCHNRVGHPFPYPERAVDEAIADGRLSRDLPYAKKEMVNLLTNDYPDQETALVAVEQVKARYESTYPELAVTHAAEIEQAAQTARELIKRLVFEKPGVTWESFPDNSRHKEFAGCFRCHNGKHLSPEGESIRLHCNICHSIPLVVGEGDRPPALPLGSIQEPASHLEVNFIADHRFQANGECVECHGEIAFGDDDSSFCANSACHGQAWPSVELDAAFPHPVTLEGKHAQAWCHDCHEGVAKPEYECANCHEPPTQPHFGETCEDCHTPDGFELAIMPSFQHPVPLEGEHAELDCMACHSAGLDLTYECATCHEPPPSVQPHFGETCEDCHTPDGFIPANLENLQHPIPLEGKHATVDCIACHNISPTLSENTCTSCHQSAQDHPATLCQACHNPEGWAESVAETMAQAPPVSHSLEGMADCLLCHDPSGKAVPSPADHKSFANETCMLCHQAAP